MPDLTELRSRIACGLAGERDFAEASRADVVAIKSDPELTRYRFVPASEVAKAEDAIDEERREATWVASDESQDSMGDIIRVKGWDLSRYKSNPSLLWAHDQKAPPIGIVSRMRKAEASDGRPALMATGTLFDRETDEFADRVWRIMKAGGLPGVSVGFQAGEINDPGDDDERKEIGLGKWGVEFVKGHELLELSVVPVPANQNALRERCIKSADAEIERWLRDGEVTPAFVQEFRSGLLLTEEQVAARARSRKRSVVAMSQPAPDLASQLEAAERRAAELAADKALLSDTMRNLMRREDELCARALEAEERAAAVDARNEELSDLYARLRETVEEHSKGRGDAAQQPRATERGAESQQPPSGERRIDAIAQAFAHSLTATDTEQN